jgi:predicted alpha/beta hydrolase
MNVCHKFDAVKTYEIKLSFNDQTHTTLTVFEKHDRHDKPLFLILPALGVRASYYNPLAHTIGRAGYTAITTDWRGIGKSSVTVDRTSRFGYHEILTIDLPDIFNRIGDGYPDAQVYILGHSLGGQIGLLYAALNPHAVHGAVLVAAGSNYYKNLKTPRRYGRYFNLHLIRWITSICGYFPGDKIGFAGRESKTMIYDWLNEALSGKYSVANNTGDFEKLLTDINIPVLFVTLINDYFVTSACAQFLAAKLKTASVSSIEIDAADYGLKQFNHFNWAKKPTPVFQSMINWLPIAEEFHRMRLATNNSNQR